MAKIKIFWNEIAGALSYDIEYKLAADPTYTYFNNTVNNFIEIEPLSLCEIYDVRITTNCDIGTDNTVAVIQVDNGTCTDDQFTLEVWIDAPQGEVQEVSSTAGGYYDYVPDVTLGLLVSKLFFTIGWNDVNITVRVFNNSGGSLPFRIDAFRNTVLESSTTPTIIPGTSYADITVTLVTPPQPSDVIQIRVMP